MRDITPQEKIDLIDLVRYAYENKYIRRYTEIKMVDPVRKITQRILSKMFKGGNIIKNRGRGSYNVSFSPETKYHGDRPQVSYYCTDIKFQPQNVSNLYELLVSLTRRTDKAYWPYLLGFAEEKKYHGKSPPGSDRYGYHRSDIDENIIENPYEPEYIEKLSQHIKETKLERELVYIRKLCYLFTSHYKSNFLHADVDENIARFVNDSESVINEQPYGFSFSYMILNRSSERYYGGRYISDTRAIKQPIVRRFNKESPIIRRLEAMKEAHRLFNKIIERTGKIAPITRAWEHLNSTIHTWAYRDQVLLQLIERNRGHIAYNACLDKIFHLNLNTDEYEKYRDDYMKLKSMEREEKRQALDDMENVTYDTVTTGTTTISSSGTTAGNTVISWTTLVNDTSNGTDT